MPLAPALNHVCNAKVLLYLRSPLLAVWSFFCVEEEEEAQGKTVGLVNVKRGVTALVSTAEMVGSLKGRRGIGCGFWIFHWRSHGSLVLSDAKTWETLLFSPCYVCSRPQMNVDPSADALLYIYLFCFVFSVCMSNSWRHTGPICLIICYLSA